MTHRTPFLSLFDAKLRTSGPTARALATSLLGALVLSSVGLVGCDVGGELAEEEDGLADETSSSSGAPRPGVPRPTESPAPGCEGSCPGEDLGFAARSCADLLDVNPSAPSGVYRIRPAGVSAPLDVYCDMVTDGGGWTALPLRFADASLWSIERSGADCVEVTEVDDGVFAQHHTAQIDGFADTAFRFVPGIEVREVRFVDLQVATSGGKNTMDIAIGAISTSNHIESWWFADADPAVARGFVFAEEQCPAPFVASSGKLAQCTLDPAPTAELVNLERRVAYDEAAPLFQTVVRESCTSNLPTDIDAGEAFTLRTGPDADGIWRSGIFVR